MSKNPQFYGNFSPKYTEDVRHYLVAVDGQTAFSVNYTIGFVTVYQNGRRLSLTDYTATTGTGITLTTGASIGDDVICVGRISFDVANAITLAAGDARYQPLDAQLSSLIRQNSQNAGYTCVATDSGKHIYCATAGAFTIPANSSIAYQVGTAITFVNLVGACTLVLTSDTMYQAGVGVIAGKILNFAQYGQATALKVAPTTWMYSGSGLS